MKRLIVIFLLFMSSLTIFGEPLPKSTNYNFAQVLSVTITNKGGNSYLFSVTLKHNDQGWNHYADAWDVIDADTGKVLATRVLQHPHDKEQPFTRSLSNIVIPSTTKKIIIRGKCNVHGYGGKTIEIGVKDLPKKGESLKIQ